MSRDATSARLPIAILSQTRDRHALVELSHLPWWVSVVLAGLVFVVARWAVPAVAGSRPTLAAIAHAIASHAHWLAAIFLLPVPFALLHTARRKRLLAAQPSLDRINALSWQEFEHLVAEAYRRRGYRVRERGGSGADGGIDLELRAKDKTLVVQCKRWNVQAVGVERVRELYGAMVGEQAHGAIVVTSGRYTPDAIEFARDKPIKLVDGGELVELLKAVQGTRYASEKARVRRTESPVITTAEGPITCPQCGSSMVRRVARQGANAGGEFWGCTRFPACRGTRPLALERVTYADRK